VIFAGDFAQLPPVSGRKLYDPTAGIIGMSPKDQRNGLGRMAWHQVTRAVLLRENMRQTAANSEDDKFRSALINMRHRNCTTADIQFLRGMVAPSGAQDSILADPRFRHISIITGLNAERDAINDKGCEKFARDTGQILEAFHSVDSIGDGDDDWYTPRRSGTKRWVTDLKDSTKDLLWGLTHHASDNVPGVLRLCRGMPVIIKKNHATECGVTNGGEGTAVDWISHQDADGNNVLDVLFVKLSNNKYTVQVEGLPPNVVPVCAETDTIRCRLPTDARLSIKRSQVRVLPNFAMTDYASQGKTREYNVADLHNLRSHQAYYTALSRSSTASNTVILQGFSLRHLQGGLSPALLSEFRDLELLDDMTRLEYEGHLHPTVTSHLRFPRIAQFLSTRTP
ncbi:hypothetical protein EXIGLDRAFT_574704, partial [Exidia glandulosa HHB12029]